MLLQHWLQQNLKYSQRFLALQQDVLYIVLGAVCILEYNLSIIGGNTIYSCTCQFIIHEYTVH